MRAHLEAADHPELVEVPAVRYVTMRGSGAPGTDDFYAAMARVGERARELWGGAEPVTEIQYWYPDGSLPVEIADFYSVNPVASLEYRVLAEVPGGVGADVSGGFEVLTIPAHTAVQVMHHGPFAEEFGTLARLGEFACARGVRRSGPHHELHLDAFTRATPQEGLRTILRDPVS